MAEYRSRRRVSRYAIALATASLLSAPVVSAHHGWSLYGTEEFQITGTVDKTVSLAGPHATMTIKSEGQVWNLVLAPGIRTERAGLKDGMIPVGAQVVAAGHRHRDPKKFEVKTERLTWNGRTFNVYPDRD